MDKKPDINEIMRRARYQQAVNLCAAAILTVVCFGLHWLSPWLGWFVIFLCYYTWMKEE